MYFYEITLYPIILLLFSVTSYFILFTFCAELMTTVVMETNYNIVVLSNIIKNCETYKKRGLGIRTNLIQRFGKQVSNKMYCIDTN